MDKIVVYFQGYGSRHNGPKVDRLRNMGYTVYSFEREDDNPDDSILNLIINLDKMFLDHVHMNYEYVFIGTSLGAWYASKLGAMYGVKTLLLNPCIDPSVHLQVDPEIKSRYAPFGPIVFVNSNTVLSADDELFHNVYFDEEDFLRQEIHEAMTSGAGSSYTIVMNAGGHRFDSEAFERCVSEFV